MDDKTPEELIAGNIFVLVNEMLREALAEDRSQAQLKHLALAIKLAAVSNQRQLQLVLQEMQTWLEE